MAKGRKRGKKIFWCGLGIFVLVFVGTFFGVQYFTKTGVFRIPGVVYYDESLNDDELAVLAEIFTDEIDLDKDVTISARNELALPELHEGEFLYNIYVPVTDFYSIENGITVASADELFTNCLDCSYKLIPVDDLDFTRRLLKINDQYYLDDFKSGAVFRIISFESELYEEEIAPLIGDALQKTFPESDTVLTFAQTGVTALSRGMNQKLYRVGDATYFAENIKDFLSQFDLTHTSNESSFTDYASASNICSDKRFVDTLLSIGLDIVELTGNHNQDCGDVAALETIDTYIANGIKIVGGGKTADEAAAPLEIDEKGTGITMLAYNLSTGGATYDDTPGANQYYDEVAGAQIAEAKARGDFVIVDIQYYECNAYASTYEDATCDYADSSAGDQVGFFRSLIDMGADVVVGTAAHQPQTFELYGDGAIYYGLGNLFFDQIWWPGTTRSLVLVHHFYNGKLLQTEIVPTVYGDEMQTRLMDEETREWFLERLISVRP
ncbi:CapA family protein [Candidatus Saccharibacteria bacterium]|nr:CapA family protein [Candidatus Saccharibacteria bacterium]